MSRHRILLVDDEPDVRAVVASALSTRFEVIEAQDGLDALSKLDDYQPDFAIIDAKMPVMDGYQLCGAIRRHDDYRAIPVLFLSAFGTKENIRKGYAAGCNLFMTKPIDPMRVLKNVQFTIEHENPPARKKTFTLAELKNRAAQSPYSPPPPEPEPVAATAEPEQIREKEYYEEPVTPAAEPSAEPNRYEPEADVYSKEEFAESFEEEVLEPGEKDFVEEEEVLEPSADLELVPRVMIVDNDDDTRELMEMALRDHHEITTARDGVEAIENIVKYQPDMLVIDLMMPRMNGFQLLQSIRRNAAFERLPVLVVSAKATPRDQAYVKRMGANEFLPKPFKVEDFEAIVSRFVDAPEFEIKDKRIPFEEMIEQEYLKAKDRFDVQDQKDRQRKFSDLQEIINQESDSDRRR